MSSFVHELLREPHAVSRANIGLNSIMAIYIEWRFDQERLMSIKLQSLTRNIDEPTDASDLNNVTFALRPTPNLREVEENTVP